MHCPLALHPGAPQGLPITGAAAAPDVSREEGRLRAEDPAEPPCLLCVRIASNGTKGRKFEMVLVR